MTCRRVRKLMPLAAGGDLRPRPMAAFRAHVDACPSCREEFEAFRADLAAIKMEARARDAGDWREAEWTALMARVRADSSLDRSGDADHPGSVLRPRWAAASALGTLAAAAILLMLFLAGPGPGRKTANAGGGPIVSEAKPQDVLTMTMVFPETGLQVVWFFDKDFDYKGEQE